MRNTGAARRAGSVRHRRVSEANLEVERFGLPNKPSGTPEQLGELVRCGDWGRACEPSPLPPSYGATLQSGSTPDSSPYTGEPGSAAKEGGRERSFFGKIEKKC